MAEPLPKKPVTVGSHDNFNIVQFRLESSLVARVDARVVEEANVTGTVSRNAFCKRVLVDALEKCLSTPTNSLSDASSVPAE